MTEDMKLHLASLAAAFSLSICCAHGGVTNPAPVLVEQTSKPSAPVAAPKEDDTEEEAAAAPREEQKVDCGRGKYCVPYFRLAAGIDQKSVDATISWLEAAKAAEPVAVVIELTTPGGSVDSGFRLIRAIETSPVPVVCVVDHKAMSEGFAILEACHLRSATPRSQLMTHTPYVNSLAGGTLEDLENVLGSLKATAHSHAIQCSKRLKVSFEEYSKKVSGGKSWFMGADEALAVGAIDFIAPTVESVVLTLRQKGIEAK